MARKAARANLFEVAGGATSVTYATTGIAGQPSFHFRDADHDVNAEGTDIRTKKTELGALVTIDLDVVADGPSTTATLVLPTVNLGDQTEQKLGPWPSSPSQPTRSAGWPWWSANFSATSP